MIQTSQCEAIMNLYEVQAFEKEIERIAEENEGEISDEQLKELIELQMKSEVQINNLVKYIRHLELGIDACKTEEDRIKTMRQRAEKRIDNIKRYMTPYVRFRNGIEVGTFKLSVRKSEKVILVDSFDDKTWMRKIPEKWEPDKNMIKKALKDGIKIEGASLKDFDNLQIK